MSPRKYPGSSIERHDAAKERQRQRIAGIRARKTARAERLRAELSESQYGTAQPQIRLTGGDHEHYREVHAELLQLAAAVELASISTREGWLVRIQMDGDFAGRVVVELIEGTGAEAESAMAILTEVVRKAHFAQAKAAPV